jgi:hypothetical protein
VNNTGNSIVLGRSADSVRVPGNLNVTGSMDVTGDLNITGILNVTDHATIDGFLDVNNNASFVGIDVSPGGIKVSSLGSSGSEDLCRNGFRQISTCSSSLRYKSNVETFFGGLDIVRRLRPITFTWKEAGRRDVGFVAEEVEQVEPLLTTYNDKGEIEGVKYKQLTTVLVNAVNEQQRTITQQQRQIEQQQNQLRLQQQQLGALKKLVCLSHPQADLCK